MLEGLVDASEKEKMKQYPSIGIARTHPYPVYCGPFTSIQLEI